MFSYGKSLKQSLHVKRRLCQHGKLICTKQWSYTICIAANTFIFTHGNKHTNLHLTSHEHKCGTHIKSASENV